MRSIQSGRQSEIGFESPIKQGGGSNIPRPFENKQIQRTNDKSSSQGYPIFDDFLGNIRPPNKSILMKEYEIHKRHPSQLDRQPIKAIANEVSKPGNSSLPESQIEKTRNSALPPIKSTYGLDSSNINNKSVAPRRQLKPSNSHLRLYNQQTLSSRKKLNDQPVHTRRLDRAFGSIIKKSFFSTIERPGHSPVLIRPSSMLQLPPPDSNFQTQESEKGDRSQTLDLLKTDVIQLQDQQSEHSGVRQPSATNFNTIQVNEPSMAMYD